MGVLLVGMGAVSSTIIAGAIAIRRGLANRGEALMTHLGLEYYD
ncbi:MAG: inositol-3-phosphate synthase [Vicinamibacterales bacterium]